MKIMFARQAIICINLICVYLFISILKAEDNSIITNQHDLIMMQDYLFKVGDRFNCYFTIEAVNKNDGSPALHRSLINASSSIASDPKIRTINDLITVLSNRLTNFSIITNDKNKQVIHIIQTELYNQKNYVLNDMVTLTYNGSLGYSQDSGLATALGQRLNNRIGPRTSGVLNITLFDDYTTTIKVNANKLNVRDILTDFVPLKNYRRIIWLAETSSQSIKPQTTIQYFGPKTKS